MARDCVGTWLLECTLFVHNITHIQIRIEWRMPFQFTVHVSHWVCITCSFMRYVNTGGKQSPRWHEPWLWHTAWSSSPIALLHGTLPSIYLSNLHHHSTDNRSVNTNRKQGPPLVQHRCHDTAHPSTSIHSDPYFISLFIDPASVKVNRLEQLDFFYVFFTNWKQFNSLGVQCMTLSGNRLKKCRVNGLPCC